MKSNTFKLIKIFENTCEIKTQSSVVHTSHVDVSLISPFRKSKNVKLISLLIASF